MKNEDVKSSIIQLRESKEALIDCKRDQEIHNKIKNGIPIGIPTDIIELIPKKKKSYGIYTYNPRHYWMY